MMPVGISLSVSGHLMTTIVTMTHSLLEPVALRDAGVVSMRVVVLFREILRLLHHLHHVD
jgi:hypothetical protein